MATGSWSHGLLNQHDRSRMTSSGFSSIDASTVAVTTRSIRDPAQGVYEYLEERHEEQGAKVGCYLFPMQLSGWMLRREGLFAKKYKRRFCVFDAATNQLTLYEDDNTSADSGKLLRKLVVSAVTMTVHDGVGDLDVTGYEPDKEVFKEDSDRLARRRSSSGGDRHSVHLPGDQQRFYRPQLERLRTVSVKAANVWSHCFRHHMKNYRKRQQLVRLAQIQATGEWDLMKDEELFDEDDDDDGVLNDGSGSNGIEPEFVFRESRLDPLTQRGDNTSSQESRLVFDGESSVRITKNGDFSTRGFRLAGLTEDIAPRELSNKRNVPLLRRDSTGSFGDAIFTLSSNASIGAFLLSSNTIWDDENLLAFRVDYDAVKRTRLLSSGAFGEVWLAQYRGSQTIAVKTLKTSQDRKRSQIQSFLNEIRLLSQLQHDRIVEFLGLAWTMESDVQLLMEYMPYGDLRTYLVYLSSQQAESKKKTPSKSRANAGMLLNAVESSWTPTQWRMAVDIIEGLVYLHSLRDPLVHCDLKSRNLLLDVNLRVKIADFGIAQFATSEPRDDRDRDTSTTDSAESSNSTGSRYALSNHASSTNVLQGTGRWLAPELLAGASPECSPAVDIYSFGVVLTEIDTSELPFHDRMVNQAGQAISEEVLLHHILTDRWTPSFLPTCPSSVLAIAKECMAFEPHRRPTSLDVAYRMRKAMAIAVGKKSARK